MDRKIDRTWSELNEGNAREILLYLLSSDSTGSAREPVSTHPFKVDEVVYTPCEVENPYDPHGDNQKPIFLEITKLYENINKNPSQLAGFWKGLDSIVADFDYLAKRKELGKYGQAELLEAFFTIGIPSEDTLQVPSNLQEMIISGRYKNKPATLWPVWEEGRKLWDLHWKTIRAYCHLQRAESVDFWKELFNDQYLSVPHRDEAKQIAVLDLTVSDKAEAQSYLREELGNLQDLFPNLYQKLEGIVKRIEQLLI